MYQPVPARLASPLWKAVIPAVAGVLVLLVAASPGRAGGGGIESVQWTALLGGTGDDVAFDVAGGAADVFYVAGATTSRVLAGQRNAGRSDAFLAKYAPSGRLMWLRLLGSPGDESALGVAVAPDGSIYIAGETSSRRLAGEVSNGGRDAFVARYTPGGVRRWVSLAGDAGDDAARDVAVSPKGKVWIAGDLTSPTAGRGVAGRDIDGFIVGIDPTSGSPGRLTIFGGSGDDMVNVLAIGPNGIAIGGESDSPKIGKDTNAGGTDVLECQFSAAGWLRSCDLFGGDGDDGAQAGALVGRGNLWFCGSTTSPMLGGQTNAGGIDIFLAGRQAGQPAGTFPFVQLLGGPDDDACGGLFPFGNTWFIGGYTDTVGPNGLNRDAVIARFGPTGLLDIEFLGGTGTDGINGMTLGSGPLVAVGATTGTIADGQRNAGKTDVAIWSLSYQGMEGAR